MDKEDALETLETLQAELDVSVEKLRKLYSVLEQAGLLQSDIQKTYLEAKKQLKLLTLDSKQANDVEVMRAISKAKTDTNRLSKVSADPAMNSIFIRFFLGKVKLKMLSEKDKLRLRDEYNKFKIRTAIIYLLFPLIVLFFHYYLRYVWTDTHWINVFYQLWLLYYNISLALRENILAINGSNIRPWWLMHNYLAALATVVFIVWPATEKYEAFVPYYTTWRFYSGLVKNLQNYYHGSREYANRALGKIKHYDITYQETLTEYPKEFLLLVPFLFGIQIWQILLGLKLLKTWLFECAFFKTSWMQYTEELQIITLAILLMFMGVGNLHATYVSFRNKKAHEFPFNPMLPPPVKSSNNLDEIGEPTSESTEPAKQKKTN